MDDGCQIGICCRQLIADAVKIAMVEMGEHAVKVIALKTKKALFAHRALNSTNLNKLNNYIAL
ncbi:hypothetical protein RG47T_4368 [Mucilaginibacter polytrichastri]|uniref:Uncharacterized protein n=1 Tax=Mucilaginibacter polytrichastri TaxID=1302689 RepID=A0A1Q6A4G3_9SPHI|nr:hypothetical protein RG47T_4368 [Mucilaginibacter polytrichastri]